MCWILSALCGGICVYTAGKKPATCRTCGKTFPRPNTSLSQTSCLPKVRGKRETGVENPLPACHATVETFLPPCLGNHAWSLGVTHHANNRKRTAKMRSWRTAQKPIRPRSTRRSRQTTICGKFSRTCQRNTRHSSTVTVSSRKCNRWMMRKLPYWQPKGNSCLCKVGSKNRKTIWSESRKGSNRSRRNVWKSCKIMDRG